MANQQQGKSLVDRAQNVQAPAGTPAAIYKGNVQSFMDVMTPRVIQMLPSLIDKDRFVQLLVSTFKKTPKLMQCSMDSLAGALLQCSREGLVPEVECDLIPRKVRGKMTCVYQRNFNGVLTLARRSEKYASINVGIAHEGDEIDLVEGTDNYLHIKRAFKERGEPMFFWCSSAIKDGDKSFTIMSVEDMMDFRENFASSRDFKTREVTGPWADMEHGFWQMGKKTVLMQHLKYQPKSYDGQGLQVLQADNEGVVLKPGDNDIPVLDVPVDDGQVIDNDTGEIVDDSDVVDAEFVTEETDSKAEEKEPPVRRRPAVVKKWGQAAEKITSGIKLDEWRANNRNKIIEELPHEEDQTVVFNFIQSLYDELLGNVQTGDSPAETVKCPDGNIDVLKADCEGAPCQEGCSVFGDGPEDTDTSKLG